jgi:alkylation response protein AidB-like acyl-CoA dehydrogenase
VKLVHTAEQRELSEMLRDLFSDMCPPTAVRAYKEGGSAAFPDQLWSTLVRTGLLGLGAPDQYGGDGASLFELGILFYEAGRVLCPSIVENTLLFRVAVERLATEQVKEAILPRLIEGEIRATLAVWNPNDASDVSPSLKASQVDGRWTLEGSIPFVPDTQHADLMLVTAAVDGVDGESWGSAYGFIIRPGLDGWTARDLSMMAGTGLSHVSLSRYPVEEFPPMAGPTGEGLSRGDLDWVANAAVALRCMNMSGGAASVLDRTAAYLQVREQFGRPIGSFQAAQHHIANMRMASDAAFLTASQASWLVSGGDSAAREVSIAKMVCSSKYTWITLTAHHLHGGIGFVRETDLHLWSERAKTAELLDGSPDVAAVWLGREMGLTAS